MLYPWPCIVCRGGSDQADGVCKQCYPLLPWCKSVCTICGLPVAASEFNHLICGRCQRQRPYYDRLVAPLWYQPPISQMITDFKYFNRWECARLLTSLFAQYCQNLLTDVLIVPVPSHSSRIRQRGFNAVLELVRLLKANSQTNFDSNFIQRVIATETQTGKTKSQRRRNVRNAFKILRPIKYKRVILFDDVVTTGATVNELSKCLKRHGVKYVEVWAIARTRLPIKI